MRIDTTIKFEEMMHHMKWFKNAAYIATVLCLLASVILYVDDSYTLDQFLFSLGMVALIFMFGRIINIFRRGIKKVIDED